MVYTLDYIRKYMNKLDKITGFDSSDIKLETSKRMTRAYAYNQMKWDNLKDIRNRKLHKYKMVYSEALLNCGASEEQIEEIIKHEYCHAWADEGCNIENKHTGKRFIECCNFLGCDSQSASKDKELGSLKNEYLIEKSKSKYKNKFSYARFYNSKMKYIRYLDENYVRYYYTVKDNVVNVKLYIMEKYSGCKELMYLFDTAVKETIKFINANKDMQLIEDVKYSNVDGYRKVTINYEHFNLIKKGE